MERRLFLNSTLTAATGFSLFPSVLSGCVSKHDPLHDFGLITNVVQNTIREDHRGTLRLLADMGYKYLEFGGTWGEEPEELKRFMKETGIKPLAGGTSLAALQGDGLKETLDDCLIKTDPELVTMEVDLYWAFKGGADIRDYFNRYPGRFEIVHVKDSFDSQDLRSFACVGSGIIYFSGLFSYREVGGFKYLVVEHDKPEHEMECARSSIDYLKTLKF